MLGNRTLFTGETIDFGFFVVKVAPSGTNCSDEIAPSKIVAVALLDRQFFNDTAKMPSLSCNWSVKVKHSSLVYWKFILYFPQSASFYLQFKLYICLQLLSSIFFLSVAFEKKWYKGTNIFSMEWIKLFCGALTRNWKQFVGCVCKSHL